MTNNQPSQVDRIAADVFVGVVAGALVGTKTGVVGFVVGGLLSGLAHHLLDAPVAQVIANAT
jgi:hypothetical protein